MSPRFSEILSAWKGSGRKIAQSPGANGCLPLGKPMFAPGQTGKKAQSHPRHISEIAGLLTARSS